MSSRPRRAPSPSPAIRRALLAAAQLAVLAVLAPAAAAQDTTTSKPVPATPAKDSAASGTPHTLKDSSATVPVRDSSAVKPPKDSSAVKPVKDSSAAPARDSTAKLSAPVATVPAPVAPAVSAPATAQAAVSSAPSVTPAGVPAAPAPAASKPEETDLANPYVQRAVSLYEEGKGEAAISEYRRGITHDPLDSDTWYGLAELYHELGKDKQAIETYTLSLQAIEHAPELRVPFAEILMANRMKTEAIKVLQRGVELDPDDKDMKTMLGNVLLGVLDESTAVVAADARVGIETTPAAAASKTSGAAKSSAGATKPRPKVDRKKRKKLCKLFCPGTFDPMAPKPE